MAKRMFSSRAAGAGVILALAAPGVAACDDAPDEQYQNQQTQFQCAMELPDGSERAVDCDDVNDDSGTYDDDSGSHSVFIWTSPVGSNVGNHAPGSVLPKTKHRIGYKDSAGRTRWGLPSSGRVGNGITKTNVVGKGGAPAPAGAKAGG